MGNATLTFDAIYREVLRNYYLLYPAMNQRIPLDDPEYWDDPEMARRYLEQMGAFQGGPIRIIWSDLETFMDRLQARIPAAAARQPVGVP